jgi:hypothetical protein
MTPSHIDSRNARHADTPWFAGWADALIWVLLAVAALLLAGFTAVVSDITERGSRRSAWMWRAWLR